MDAIFMGALPPPMQSRPWHSSGGPPPIPYHGSWPGSSVVEGRLSPDSEARASRRHKRQRNDIEVAARNTGGKKPHQLVVKAGGEIDPTCAGKNVWDNAVRVSTPRILDMSVVDWETQKPASVALLRETLEKDFEYVGHTLSVHGFRLAIKKYMKVEKNRLKHKFMAGKVVCPVHIDPVQWEKLQEYWKTDRQVAKTTKMQHAHAHVKDYSAMGRRGRAGKELAVREGKERSPGLTEIEDGMLEMQENSPTMVGATSAVRAKLIALEEKQNDMVAKHEDLEGKMTQMLLNQAENTNSMEEVKSMLRKCMEQFCSAEDFSGSIGISVQDTQAQLDLTKQQVIPTRSNTPFKTPGPMVSMHMTESSGDSDTPKHVAPSTAKVKEHISSLKDQPMEDALQLDVVHNAADPTSTGTPAAACALVNLGGPMLSTELSLNDSTTVAVKDLSIGIDKMPTVVEEEVPNTVEEVPVKDALQKVLVSHTSVSDSKKPMRTWRLRKVADNIQKDPPTLQKVTATAIIVELSPEVATRPLRTSPRKQKVLLKSSVEGSVTPEEDSIKIKAGKQDTKKKAPPKKKPQAKKFVLRQEVFLLNLMNVKQSVAAGVISGAGVQHKFHFVPISDSCYKVDVKEAIWPQVSLMFPHLIDEQVKVKDVVGTCALWEGKFLRAAK